MSPAGGSSSALNDLSDSRYGSLAEALAIADVLEIVAARNLELCATTFATLSHMLAERLNRVRDVMVAEVSHG